jgi:VanZ family protein
VLTLLVWRTLRKPPEPNTPAWRWSEAGLALALAALYAAGDEIHQVFVPSRQCSIWDVLLDTTGAAIDLLCLWAVGRVLKRW